MSHLYTAQCSFIEGDREQSHHIAFAAADDDAAARGVWSWIRNRKEALPEVFGRIGAIKIWSFHPREFDDDGYLASSTGAMLYEWKYDWGMPEGHV